jgi:hypothetical protein
MSKATYWIRRSKRHLTLAVEQLRSPVWDMLRLLRETFAIADAFSETSGMGLDVPIRDRGYMEQFFFRLDVYQNLCHARD